jgi:hypothetical protein
MLVGDDGEKDFSNDYDIAYVKIIKKRACVFLKYDAL